MAKEAKKTLIGAFVVGAIALAVIGVTVFGSGKFFQKRPTFVMFFSGSITGLSVGSPVEFRGVRIGQITKITAIFNPKDLEIIIPVYFEFDPKSLAIPGEDRKFISEGPYEFYKPLLDKGLKAQLAIQSIITGQLYVSVDFHPEVPAKLVGLDMTYPEIPTIPSDMEQLTASLQKIPDKVIMATEGVEKLVTSPAIQESMQNLAVVLRDLDVLLKDVGLEIKPLLASMRRSSDGARRTFAQAEKTLSLTQGPSAEMAASFTDTMKKAGASLEQMRSTLVSYEKIADQNANVGYDLNRTLGELDGAARALRSLADYLERHPEALLKGKE